jgi:hypothetical protein
MNPAWEGFARRNWQAFAALLVFLVFAAVHAVVFRPVLARYQRDVRQATELGMPIDDAGGSPAASARVTALIAGNSLNAAVAEEQGTSGALTAGLLDEVTRLVAKSGLEIVATEQGVVTQLPGSVQVRAHLKLGGRYAEFVDLLGRLSRSGSLVTVDRFDLQGDAAEGLEIELWLTQHILKRTRSAR